MSTQEVVELLVQAGRVLLAEREGARLTSSQWMALRFFARANSFSRTLSGFAAYQATTRGTASQTIKVMEKDGYLERERSTRDGRSSILRITVKGRKALDEDPIAGLIDVIDDLDEPAKLTLRNTLRRVVAHLADGQSWKPVGSCRDCCFLLTRRQRAGIEPAFTKCLCRAIGLPVDESELDLLCVSFQPLEEPRGLG
jgi:DNA-binding MarR family transcriptional regulator